MVKKKDDVRRTPYNIWVGFLSLCIFLCFLATSAYVVNLGWQNIQDDAKIVGMEDFLSTIEEVCTEKNCTLGVNSEIMSGDREGWSTVHIYDNGNQTVYQIVPVHNTLQEGSQIVHIEYTKTREHFRTSMTCWLVALVLLVLGIMNGIKYYNNHKWSRGRK